MSILTREQFRHMHAVLHFPQIYDPAQGQLDVAMSSLPGYKQWRLALAAITPEALWEEMKIPRADACGYLQPSTVRGTINRELTILCSELQGAAGAMPDQVINTEFYDSLEGPIRELVRALRDNGINTTNSCGHDMTIEADLPIDGTLQEMHNTLYNWLSEEAAPVAKPAHDEIGYSVDVHLEVERGIVFRCYADIKIGSPMADVGRGAEDSGPEAPVHP